MYAFAHVLVANCDMSDRVYSNAYDKYVNKRKTCAECWKIKNTYTITCTVIYTLHRQTHTHTNTNGNERELTSTIQNKLEWNVGNTHSSENWNWCFKKFGLYSPIERIHSVHTTLDLTFSLNLEFVCVYKNKSNHSHKLNVRFSNGVSVSWCCCCRCVYKLWQWILSYSLPFSQKHTQTPSLTLSVQLFISLFPYNNM